MYMTKCMISQSWHYITVDRNDLAGDVLDILTGYRYLCLIFAASRVLINDMMVFNQKINVLAYVSFFAELKA